MDCLVDIGEIEQDVPHRPGKLYKFDYNKFEKKKKKKWPGIDFQGHEFTNTNYTNYTNYHELETASTIPSVSNPNYRAVQTLDTLYTLVTLVTLNDTECLHKSGEYKR